jgi:WD40 repeat protein
LAVGTSIGQVKLFDTKTGELVRALDDEAPRLADRETPESWKSMKRAMGSVARLAFSPDGSLLAVCGTSFGEYSDIFDGVESLGRLATGPGRLKVFEVKTGRLKHDLAGHSHVYDVAFSADGALLASAGRWGGNEGNGTGVITWNTESGTKVTAIAKEVDVGVHRVTFSPTRKMVAIGAGQYDKEYDSYSTSISVAFPMSGITQWQQTLPGHAQPKAFTPDGTMVAVLCGGQSIQFIDVETGQVTHEIKAADSPGGGRWSDFAIASKASVMVIGRADGERKGSVEIWKLGGDGGGGSEPAKEGGSLRGKEGR